MTLVQKYLAASDFSAEDTWRLVEWCQRLGADEFTIDCVGMDPRGNAEAWCRFEKAVQRFSREEQTRERMSGRTADDLTRHTELWELNDQTLEALKQALPGGLLGYDPSEHGALEDPVLYRRGKLMLGVLSHEAFAVLRLTDLESAQLSAAGFSSHNSLPRIG